MAAPRLQVLVRHTAVFEDLTRQAVAARRRRDRAMRAAYQRGVSIVAIATAARLTPARVSAILGYPRQRPGRPPHTTPPPARSC